MRKDRQDSEGLRQLRKMRDERGWTQTRLAEAAGMTQPALARFEPVNRSDTPAA